MGQDFEAFVRARLDALNLSQRAAETIIGRDQAIRSVFKGNQLPPMHELHKWAAALQLDESGRLELLRLADEAHGGGTIAGWIAETVQRLNEQADERDKLIAQLALEVQKLKQERDAARGRQ